VALTVLPHRDELGIKAGRCYIDGEWVDGSGEVWTHHHPATGEAVSEFAIATAGDVDRAVQAARRAFDEGGWTGMNARDRRRLLQGISRLVDEHGDELNRIQTLDNGMPQAFCAVYQMGAGIAADLFDYHAGWVDKIRGATLPTYTGSPFVTMTLKEPVGVVGAVIPWNAPLMLFAQKVAPALAAGCTVVLKPSEHATQVVLRLVTLMEEAGLPAGVLNVVCGPGDPTGEALITHPGVDKLTFTGSRTVGKRVMAAAAGGVKRVSLELGGKSPNIVFADADIATAAASVMGMVSMGLSGQGCACHTRALIEESIYDEVVSQAADMAVHTVYGDPFDLATTSAALITPLQAERVCGFIEAGQEEGARLVVGGDRPAGDLAAGNFVNPTLFADVDNHMTIATEEIFGPVVAAIPFRDEEHAIALANDTTYGLAGSVHTNDVRRALRVAKAVRAGTFGINGYTVVPSAPFGGMAQSGLGREGGSEGLEAFLETKTVTIALTNNPL
jgi:aldehyde dehydrogenase (NAD+)